MELEQVKPKQPSFGIVVLLFAVTILIIIIAVTFVVSWRAHEKNKPPFTKHPVSRMYAPGLTLPSAG